MIFEILIFTGGTVCLTTFSILLLNKIYNNDLQKLQEYSHQSIHLIQTRLDLLYKSGLCGTEEYNELVNLKQQLLKSIEEIK